MPRSSTRPSSSSLSSRRTGNSKSPGVRISPTPRPLFPTWLRSRLRPRGCLLRRFTNCTRIKLCRNVYRVSELVSLSSSIVTTMKPGKLETKRKLKRYLHNSTRPLRPIALVHLGRCRAVINASTPFIPMPPLGKQMYNCVAQVSPRNLTPKLAYRFRVDPKLRPEVGLSRERRESVGQAIVRLLQGHDAETSDIIRPVKPGCRARPERGRSYTHLAQLLDGMGKEVFDRPQRGSGEVQGPLDLEAMCGSKLSEHDQCADLQLGEIRWPGCRSK